MNGFLWNFVFADIFFFSKICREKCNFSLKSVKNNGYFHEHLCTFMKISRCSILTKRNFWTKIVQKIKTHFTLNFFLNHAVYEIMWKHIVQPDRSQMRIKHGACALNAGLLRLQIHIQNAQYLLIFPLQQWLYLNSSQRYVICTLRVLYSPSTDWYSVGSSHDLHVDITDDRQASLSRTQLTSL
jgi:hypothetical protein